MDECRIFVPGRLCLFGEHSDWAGALRMFNANIAPGEAIVTGIEQGITAVATKNPRFILESAIPGEEDQRLDCPMDPLELKRIAQGGGWFSYVAGVAFYMSENHQVGGATIRLIERRLPVKRGLSSSAAICVLVTRVFNQLYDLRLSTKGEMQAAYLGEQHTPSRCGRLDQACAFGVRPVHMVFDGGNIEVEGLNPRIDLHYVFADLMANKDTVKILADLNSGYPYPRSAAHRRLHEALGAENHAIVTRARTMIEQGDAAGLGRLMQEAQVLFDAKVAPICPDELSAPVLHSTLQDPNIRQWTYGGKGVGSQGDGTVQFLAKDASCQRMLTDYLNEQRGMDAYAFTIKRQQRVSKAIIPIAGYATRLFPASKALCKALFPVVDETRIAKPAILVLLEELERAGIRRFALVINDADEMQLMDKVFKMPLSDENAKKLPVKMREYDQKIRRLGERIEYIIQKDQRGFGHAVYQCREFAGGEPVLLALGDTLYRSDTEQSCTQQLLNAFEKLEKTCISLQSVPAAKSHLYGMLCGEWMDAARATMNVTQLIEKPDADYAKEFMGMPSDGGTEYYAVFGQYVLTPHVFEQLEQRILLDDQSEVGLTQSLDDARRSAGVYGVRIDGVSLDIGVPDAYRETMARFGDAVT